MQNLSAKERKQLAKTMFRSLRCGGMEYDKAGVRYLLLGGKKCYAAEVNSIIKRMNPTWTEEQLKSYLW